MHLKNFGEFFNESPIPMWIYDTRDYSIKEINNAMLELYGYSRKQMRNFTLFDLWPEEEIPKLRKHLAKAKKFSEEGIWKHKKKNGEFIHVYVITNPVTFEGNSQTYQLAMYKDITEEVEQLEQNGQTYIIGTGIDITKQKELEEQLSSLFEKEYAQRKKAEADLDKLREMFEEAPSPKCVVEGPEFQYVIANKAYRKVVGQEEIIGKSVYEIIPEVEEQGYIDILKQVYNTGESHVGQAEPAYINKSEEDEKKEYVFNLLFAPLFDDEGKVYGIFIEMIDFSDQIAYQQQLKESLTEKDTLLAEIHHRVKNNLAIVTGMMELQAMEAKEGELRDSLRVAQQRIRTIANIHELLYGAESLSHLNFGENLKQLVQNLEEVHNSSKQISATVEVEPIRMNINQAIPCALLVNEVVTNAYKHAFKDREEGEIKVRLQEKNENVTVEIFDNGVGLPADFSQDSSTSIGMTLIKLLKQQLKGKITFSNQNGTRFVEGFELPLVLIHTAILAVVL